MITTQNIEHIRDLTNNLELYGFPELEHTDDEIFMLILVDLTDGIPRVYIWGISDEDSMFVEFMTTYTQQANTYYCNYLLENPLKPIKQMSYIAHMTHLIPTINIL